MTKARENSDYTGLQGDLAGLQTNITAGDTAARAGRKNILINGGFDVWQRGAYTSATGAAGVTYYADRFFTLISVVTATIQNTTNSAKVSATSSATGYIGLSQKVEDKVYNTLKGKTVTLSAKVTSNKSNARLRSFNGSAWADSATSHSGNGTEETLTHTFTVSSSPSNLIIQLITYDGGDVALASGDYIEVTGVQLEVGSVATDFEHRSYGEELALCQRYFERKTYASSTVITMGQAYASGNCAAPLDFIQKRVTPSITLPVSSSTGVQFLTANASVPSTFGTLSAITISLNNCRLQLSGGSGYVAGNASWLHTGNSLSVIDINAEL